MAYDTDLVTRIRRITANVFPDMDEQAMFGGFSYLLNGNFAYGANESLVVRVGKPAYSEALVEPGVREMDFTGRPMAGWVYVDLDTLADDGELERWMARGVAFAATLAPKARKGK